MEPRQGAILYVRTSDKVLLRFPSLETAQTWLAQRRLSLNDEYLATDQTWQPLDRLFRIDLPPLRREPDPRAEARARAPERTVSDAGPEPDRAPTVPLPVKPSAQEAITPREGPSRLSEGPSPVGPPTPSRREEAASTWAMDRGSFVEDIWGSEPDADGIQRVRRRRKIIGGLLAAVAAVAVGSAAWLATRPGGEEAPEPRQFPDKSASMPRLGPQAAAPEPAAPVQEAVAPAPSDGLGARPPEAGPEPAAPAPESPAATSPAVEAPAAPGKPPQPDSVAAPARAAGPAPGSPSRGPALSSGRASDDLDYDQHMAEGMRWLGRDSRRAYAHFQAAASQRPGSVEPQVKMAECEYRQGRYREAAALFQRALDRNPDYGPAIVGLARSHARLGNAQEARFLYLRYLEVNPNGSQAAEARAYLGR